MLRGEFAGPVSSNPSMAWWCRLDLVVPEGTAPDLDVVDALARLQLATRRVGGSVGVVAACDELAELLDLVGLRGQMGGQAEGGEQAGVEEGVEPGDPVA